MYQDPPSSGMFMAEIEAIQNFQKSLLTILHDLTSQVSSMFASLGIAMDFSAGGVIE